MNSYLLIVFNIDIEMIPLFSLLLRERQNLIISRFSLENVKQFVHLHHFCTILVARCESEPLFSKPSAIKGIELYVNHFGIMKVELPPRWKEIRTISYTLEAASHFQMAFHEYSCLLSLLNSKYVVILRRKLNISGCFSSYKKLKTVCLCV